MAPAKKKAAQQTLSLGEFLTDEKFGSWAEEMDETPIQPSTYRTGYGNRESSDRFGGSSFGGGFDRGSDRYGSMREELPLPTKPPYTAHVGNLAFDVTEGEVSDFFSGCDVTNVRIVMDKMEGKPKGFGYVEYGSLDGLKKALELSNTSFAGRNIRVSVAEPPKERPDDRAFGDWTRKGPLPDMPRRTSERNFGGGRGGFEGDRFSDAGSDRFERRNDFGGGDGKIRDFGNWERKGPLPPGPSAGPGGPGGPGGRGAGRPPREGGDEFRRAPAAWGEGRPPPPEGAARPPPRERVEREPTAAELDNEWRKPKAEGPGSKEPPSRERSIPTSPTMATVRPKLNLAKRSETAGEVAAAAPADSKASPFGAARPIDTAAREREVEEKRQIAIREKKEADDKARAEKKEQEEKAKAEKKEGEAGDGKPAQKIEILRKQSGTDVGADGEASAAATENGAPPAQERKASQAGRGEGRNNDSRPPRKAEGTWRRKSENKADSRADSRTDIRKSEATSGAASPAAKESPAATPASNGPDEDGWSTVSKPQKRTKGGNTGGRA